MLDWNPRAVLSSTEVFRWIMSEPRSTDNYAHYAHYVSMHLEPRDYAPSGSGPNVSWVSLRRDSPVPQGVPMVDDKPMR